MKIVGIGHSHIYALKWAANERVHEFSKENIHFDVISLVDERYKGFRVENQIGGIEGFSFQENLQNDLAIALDGADLVFSCIGGNAHNILGLVKHPRPFDFVLKENPGLPVSEAAEIVPSFLVEAALRAQGGYPESEWGLKALRKIYPGAIIHCESPPPIPSDDHLVQYAGVFKEKISQYGLSPLWLRYKLWRLHSQMIKDVCEKNNIFFLTAPQNFLDEMGFLTEMGWNPDTTHANPRYGQAVLNQVIQHAYEQIDLKKGGRHDAPI